MYTKKNLAYKIWTIGNKVEYTNDREHRKHNTICVGHHYTQPNTNNVNKT